MGSASRWLTAITLGAVTAAACAGPTIPDQVGGGGAGATAGPGGGGAGGAGASGASGGGPSGGGTSAGAGGSGEGGVSAGAGGVAGATGGGSGAGAGGGSGGAGAGSAGAGTGGASGNTSAGSGGGGASGSSGGTSAGSGGTGTSGGSGGASGGSGGSGGGFAGGPPAQDVACDFSSVGNDCITCGGASCIDTGSDPKHCGACDHACGAGVSCTNGVCGPTIVTGAGSYTPGVLFGGRLFAWGSNEYLGAWGAPNGPLAVYTPHEVLALGSDLAGAVTGDITCGVSPQGSVRCFGLNGSGQLGIDQIGGPAICGPAKAAWCHPTPQDTLVAGVTELREGVMWCGGTHLCARRADRTVACWGDMGDCDGSTAVATPMAMDVPPSAGIAVLGESSCSRSCTGRVSCWGSSKHLQLGVASGSTLVPQPIPDLRVTSLVAGYCGIREDRNVVCWGASGAGEAGVTQDTLPVVVKGVSDVVQLTHGNTYACALTSMGEVWCWGSQYILAQVGPNPPGCSKGICPTPTKIDVKDVVEIGGGAATMMGRRGDGTYVAWAFDEKGQIGNGTATPQGTFVPPTVVKGLPPP